MKRSSPLSDACNAFHPELAAERRAGMQWRSGRATSRGFVDLARRYFGAPRCCRSGYRHRCADVGGPSPDTVSGPLSPYNAITVADMLSRGWKVRGFCGKCEIVLAISLDSLARAHGPMTVLWGRTAPCPRVHENRFRCEGRMHYMAQQIGGGSWGRLKEIGDREMAQLLASRDPYTRRYVMPRDTPQLEG